MGMANDNEILARSRAASGDLIGARDAISSELSKRPKDQNLLIFRARLNQSLGHLHAALADIEAADTGKVTARFLGFRAQLEEEARHLSDAKDSLSRAIKLAPKDPGLRAHRAYILQSLGDIKAARFDVEQALKAAPGQGALFFQLAGLTKFQPESPLLEQMIEARSKSKPGSAGAYHLDFALAKAMDELGEIGKSFDYLQAANEAMRAAYPYDVAQRQAMVNRYQRVFRAFRPGDNWSENSSDFAPIFVTGMPRSGTTLVEQVISSHHRVDAAGETGLFFKHVQTHIGDPMVQAAKKLHLTPKEFANVGAGYADGMRKLAAHDTPHITDKSLQTWFYLGLVLAAMPRAKVVVVQRRPEATALSIYRHMFRPGKQLFSYNLRDIATYQSCFDAMLRFWQDRCDGGFTTVGYEDLVTSPTTEIPALIDRIDLPWDEACLSPQDNARAVMTMSASEVRQPIHTKSVDAWRKYETYLR